MDAGNQHDVRGEDGQGGTDHASGGGSANGLGGTIRIQAGPAPNQTHEQTEYSCLEGRRDDVGNPEKDQRIPPEAHW